MRLRFLGATGTVTGSRYLVEAGERRLLVDCGLFQGLKELRLRNWSPPPFDPASLDAVVLTHAHIDHSGYLPLLVRHGFRGRVYCTDSTLELCRILLPDSAHLQEEQAEHANRYGYSKHAPALPLYTRADAEAALKLFVTVPFDQDWAPVPGMIARLRPGGHILGASIATLQHNGRKLAFSGDLGRADDPVMRGPAELTRADALVMESTYGDRVHERGDVGKELGRIIVATVARGGSVIMPAFAVGRAQALMFYLHRLRSVGAIPASLPIYLDSPMAWDVTSAYLRHPSEHRLSHHDCQAMAHVARRVVTPDESRALDESSWPKVIIAGSGMATGGRVLHHLKSYAPDSRNTILFAGFQARGTRGDALVNGASEVKIHGAFVPVRAEVRNLDRLSAHADRDELLEWLRKFKHPPMRIFLTHGEPQAAQALRTLIADRLGWNAEVPDYLDTVEV